MLELIYGKKIKYDPIPEYLPPLRIKMDDWLRFFGLWLAEGSAIKEKMAII